MSERITTAHLTDRIDTVNRLLGNDPDAPYSTPGVVVLYGAYGATSVERYVNTSGGTTQLMGLGTKREVTRFLDGMIAGLEAT